MINKMYKYHIQYYETYYVAIYYTYELKTCDDTKKRWCELNIDIFWTNYLKQTKRYRKSVLPLRFRCFSLTKDSTT